MTRKILTAVAAVALSFALFMYVVMVIGPEYQDTFYDVPVTFVGETASDLMIRNETGHKVTLVLSGNRSDLNKLSSSNITVTIDRSQITEAGSRVYRYDVEFPGNVAKNAVIVQTQDPAGILLEVNRVTDNDVPVKVTYEGPLPENYVKTAGPEIRPIHIEGPEEIVNRIAYAKVVITSDTVPEDDIVGNYAYQFYDRDDKLVDATGITPLVEDRTVSVTYPIRVTKEVKLDVDVKYGGGTTAENTQYAIEPAVITVSGKQADLKDLDVLKLGEIDVGTMKESGTVTFSIDEKLKEISETIKNGTAEAVVSVTLPELTTRDFHVTQFKSINQPDGTYCVVKSTGMKVTVRGSSAVVDAMKSSDITIIVDFTGAEVGSQSYLYATAEIKDNPADVGILAMQNDGEVLVLVEDEAVVAAREALKESVASLTPVKN